MSAGSFRPDMVSFSTIASIAERNQFAAVGSAPSNAASVAGSAAAPPLTTTFHAAAAASFPSPSRFTDLIVNSASSTSPPRAATASATVNMTAQPNNLGRIGTSRNEPRTHGFKERIHTEWEKETAGALSELN